jgi:hypothetical protein
VKELATEPAVHSTGRAQRVFTVSRTRATSRPSCPLPLPRTQRDSAR